MAEMYFNAKGATHSLRLRIYDADGGVWEALVDGTEYYHFEASLETEIWELFGLAVQAYNGYRGETETERTAWGREYDYGCGGCP
jgi:hypothetical protein